jgi:hypothetical protein
MWEIIAVVFFILFVLSIIYIRRVRRISNQHVDLADERGDWLEEIYDIVHQRQEHVADLGEIEAIAMRIHI